MVLRNSKCLQDPPNRDMTRDTRKEEGGLIDRQFGMSSGTAKGRLRWYDGTMVDID